MNKVTPFLMFNDQLEAAVKFYAATFPDSKIKNVARAGKDGPVTSAEFVIGGQSFHGLQRRPPLQLLRGLLALRRLQGPGRGRRVLGQARQGPMQGHALLPALVGGARLANGCTSGHGLCGVSRFSPRSLLATVTFMLAGALTVFVGRHLLGALP